jgi:hypothetical protein
MPQVVAIEGNPTELGGVAGEASVDAPGTALGSPFVAETAHLRLPGTRTGILQAVYLHLDTQGQPVTVSAVVDDVTTALGTATTTGETALTYAANLPGTRFAVRLDATGLTKRIEVLAIEADVYVP